MAGNDGGDVNRAGDEIFLRDGDVVNLGGVEPVYILGGCGGVFITHGFGESLSADEGEPLPGDEVTWCWLMRCKMPPVGREEEYGRWDGVVPGVGLGTLVLI